MATLANPLIIKGKVDPIDPANNVLAFTPSKKADSNIVRVRVVKETLSKVKGVYVLNERKAYIPMDKAIVERLGLKEGMAFPLLEGGNKAVQKIVRKTSFTPFYEGQTPVINPTTGATMEIGGQPYFYSDNYTEDAEEMDEFLTPENVTTLATKEVEGA